MSKTLKAAAILAGVIASTPAAAWVPDLDKSEMQSEFIRVACNADGSIAGYDRKWQTAREYLSDQTHKADTKDGTANAIQIYRRWNHDYAVLKTLKAQAQFAEKVKKGLADTWRSDPAVFDASDEAARANAFALSTCMAMATVSTPVVMVATPVTTPTTTPATGARWDTTTPNEASRKPGPLAGLTP